MSQIILFVGSSSGEQNSTTTPTTEEPIAVIAKALSLLALAATLLLPTTVQASDEQLPSYLRDRGTGIATSLFGTYVRKGELLVYPFYEYTRNEDQEYSPNELGYGIDTDYRAKSTEHEGLIFVSYGLADGVIVEIESALHARARLEKAPEDLTPRPATLEESGFGDTQAEIRWRWRPETESRPELWSYFEVVFPFQKDRILIGTSEWEFIQGFGMTRGFRWGTLTTRVSASYTGEEKAVEFGEYAVEYLKRLSPAWRALLAVEGEQDEIALIAEAQWRLSPRITLKLNNGFGLTSKAPELAPEVGVALTF